MYKFVSSGMEMEEVKANMIIITPDNINQKVIKRAIHVAGLQFLNNEKSLRFGGILEEHPLIQYYHYIDNDKERSEYLIDKRVFIW